MDKLEEYERIPRIARCIQWDGYNTQCIIDILTQYGMTTQLFRPYEMIIRNESGIVYTLYINHWVLIGEDNQIRFNDDVVQKSKYRKRREYGPR